VPKVIAPRHSGLTRSPDLPSVTYSYKLIVFPPEGFQRVRPETPQNERSIH
jgi:hypothetical protein